MLEFFFIPDTPGKFILINLLRRSNPVKSETELLYPDSGEQHIFMASNHAALLTRSLKNKNCFLISDNRINNIIENLKLNYLAVNRLE